MHESDVIIVGSGQAAKPLALRMAKQGRRVVVFEATAVGGTCTNTGCTPTKTMIASARAAHVARTSGRLGIHARAVEVDLGQIVDRKDAIVHQSRSRIEASFAAAAPGLHVVRHHARFVGERTLEANGERYHAPIVVLDVGARAAIPPIAGLDSVQWLDNASLMTLRRVPEHLIIVGGGYIGCEMGQMFHRFGARVTIVHDGEQLLSHEDPEAAAAIEGVFRAEGIQLLLRSAGVEVKRNGPDGRGVSVRLAGGGEVHGSHLVVALGRRANTDGLGCEAAGVRLDARGNVVANEEYGTTAPGVYAVGDCIGGPQFTHTSWDDHRRLFDILTKPDVPRQPRTARLIPYTVFTDPQLAGVGLTEKKAKALGVGYEVASMPLAHVARAIETDETAGVMKLLVDPGGDKILGVTLVAPDAGELLHIFVALMQAGASPRAIVDAEAVHPTFAEGVQSLVMRLPRYALS
jgi:pyruvate/2-oxoglutarate dehydrogenase complex dihydrolipoamide dehydrogenase (E3) component